MCKPSLIMVIFAIIACFPGQSDSESNNRAMYSDIEGFAQLLARTHNRGPSYDTVKYELCLVDCIAAKTNAPNVDSPACVPLIDKVYKAGKFDQYCNYSNERIAQWKKTKQAVCGMIQCFNENKRSDVYKTPPTTFRAFESQRANTLPQNNEIMHDAALTELGVIVAYTGTNRKMPSNKYRLITYLPKEAKHFYAMNYGSSADEVTEIMVTQDEVNYWLSVQKSVLPFLAKELTVGKEFKAYLRHAGAINNEQVYMMIDFDAQP